jgi:hypothetical protein
MSALGEAKARRARQRAIALDDTPGINSIISEQGVQG